jgi:hypothetical protein
MQQGRRAAHQYIAKSAGATAFYNGVARALIDCFWCRPVHGRRGAAQAVPFVFYIVTNISTTIIARASE